MPRPCAGVISQMTKPILLMTRTRAGSDRFVSGLDAERMQGVNVLFRPLLEIIPTETRPEIAGYGGVIFSSSNGVAFAPEGAGRMAYCVGERTAQQAKARGWQVDLIAQDAQKLIEALIKAAPIGPLLHIAGAHRRGDIAQNLSAAGIPTEVHVAYTQPLLPLAEDAKKVLFGEVIVIVPLFSPRVAAQFGAQAVCGAHVRVLAMSQAVKDALEGTTCAGRVQIASDPTGEEMRIGVENLLWGDSLP